MEKEYYKECIEKQASIAGIVSKVAPSIAKGVKSFGALSGVKRIGLGAGVGAGLGAAKGAISNNDGNRFSSALKGVISGGLTGGLIGGSLSNQNVSKMGEKISNLGEKVFDNAAANKFGNGALNTSLGNAGIGMNNYGNKIQNYFGG